MIISISSDTESVLANSQERNSVSRTITLIHPDRINEALMRQIEG